MILVMFEYWLTLDRAQAYSEYSESKYRVKLKEHRSRVPGSDVHPGPYHAALGAMYSLNLSAPVSFIAEKG